MTAATSSVVVLDTQVVLDWLVFRDADSATLHAALAHAELRWVATPAMRDELHHVLQRGALDAWHPDLNHIRASWDRHCGEWAAPVASLSASPALRCTDPDDQKFADLAAAAGARWLISRDRAVLKLGQPLKRLHAVEVLTPAQWIARRLERPEV